MGTIEQKLSYLMDTKQAIKQAIQQQGVEVAEEDTFREYANKIKMISGGGSQNIMTEVTYAELVNLRDEGRLVAGAKYRIIDYETRVWAEEATHAGHPFDLVVTAIDGNTLDKKASAVHSARDTEGYFAGSNLASWKVWYSLDTDLNKYWWAEPSLVLMANIDGNEIWASYMGVGEFLGRTFHYWSASNDDYLLTENKNPQQDSLATIYRIGSQETWDCTVIGVESYEGKGVIYRLIDENANDAPYDFKNLMFVRTFENGLTLSDNGADTFVYTFDQARFNSNIGYYHIDGSVTVSHYAPYYHNIIEEGSWNNVFLSDGRYRNDGCYYNTIGRDSWLNTFGGPDYSSGNVRNCTLGRECYYNVIGDSSHYCILGDYCRYNYIEWQGIYIVFGTWCEGNYFLCEDDRTTCPADIYIGDDSSYNTFGKGCDRVTLGYGCEGNTFGANCSSIEFGNLCCSNTLGEECYCIEMDYHCERNVLGHHCSYSLLGSHSGDNEIGCYCQFFAGELFQSNTIEDYCLFFCGNWFYDNYVHCNSKFNSFGDYVQRCIFPEFFCWNKVGAYVYEANFTNAETASDTSVVSYYDIEHIVEVHDDVHETTPIAVSRKSSDAPSYVTYIRKKSNGEIVQYTIDDLINK